LKRKNETTSPGVIVQNRTPDKPDENQDDTGIHACAQDLLSAIESKDVKGIADALKAAFEIADSAPHKEGPHTNEPNKED